MNSEFGSNDRRPVLKIDVPEPTANYTKGMGDAIPSALADGGYLYVAYSYHSGKNDSGDLIRIARARLEDGDHGFGWEDWDPWAYHLRLEFWKWNNHAFSQPGIGGVDTAVLPAGGCTGRQQMPEVSYNEDLGLYLLIFVCDVEAADSTGTNTGFWYYSTATSLELEDWTPPVVIEGSKRPITGPCNPKTNRGNIFDGFYPSTLSPGALPGHTRLTGKVFYQDGCDTGVPRAFVSRNFTITAEW